MEHATIDDLVNNGMKEALAGHPDAMNISVQISDDDDCYYAIFHNPKWFMTFSRFLVKLTPHKKVPPSSLTLFFHLDGKRVDPSVSFGQYFVLLANKHSVVTYSGYEVMAKILGTKNYMIFKKDFYFPDSSKSKAIAGVYQA